MLFRCFHVSMRSRHLSDKKNCGLLFRYISHFFVHGAMEYGQKIFSNSSVYLFNRLRISIRDISAKKHFAQQVLCTRTPSIEKQYNHLKLAWIQSVPFAITFKAGEQPYSCIMIIRSIASSEPWPPQVYVVHGAMGCGQKRFKLVCRCHQLLFGFLANVHLPRVSRQSRLSANDKGNNETIPEAVHRSGIHLTAEENFS